MFRLLRRLFERKAAPESGSVVEELWVEDFSVPESPKGGASGESRFVEVDETGYSAHRGGRGLSLELRRANFFAWVEAPLYRHSDFVLEGLFEISAESPYSACGFLFRYQDEGNFYSALVSTKGFFRLDVVFNGSPRTLTAWTELPRPAGGGAKDRAGAALRSA